MPGPGRPLAETKNHPTEHERVEKVLKRNIAIRHHTTPWGNDCSGLKGSLCQTTHKYEKLRCDTCQKIGLFPEAQV